MGKTLVIDADDFGLTRSVSIGIIEAIKEGVVTSTNALVTSPYMEDSFDLAKQQGINKSGIHLNLEVGQSVVFNQPFKQLPSFKDKGNVKLIEEEFVCQIEALLDKGMILTHLTTHKGIINSRERVELYAKLSKQYNVPVRRLPKQWMNDLLLENGCRMVNHRLINDDGKRYSLSKMKELLQKVKNGESAELICHVGYRSKELAQLSSLVDAREAELQLFLSDELKELLVEKGINCVSFDAFT